jgi:hypothetical protein
MVTLSPEQVRLLRIRSQRLHPDVARTMTAVAPLVRGLCGLQAQDLPAATLGVRARSTQLLAEDVRRARETDRTIVLTWCMRGTLHLVPADDLGWLLPSLGPLFIHSSQRRYTQLGLDAELRARATGLIINRLSTDGPLTRAELADALAAEGIPVEGQAIAHLVRYAALTGAICLGPAREGNLTYVVLDGWVGLGGRRSEEETQTELARRYLNAYGPATPHDLASWSGLSLAQARAGFDAISNDLLQVEVERSPAWMLKSQSAWLDNPRGDPSVRLLSYYDGYLLGYRTRDFMISETHAQRIHPGGGLIRSSVMVDGRALGIWRMDRKRKGLAITVEPFEPIGEDVLPGLEAEAQDIGRFLQEDVRLSVQSL